MFCDDVVCDNGEVFVPLFCLFDMFEAEKFPFKFKGKSLKKYISFASSAPLFSLFRGLISREFGAFPALLFLLRLKNARRSVENQTRILCTTRSKAKASKTNFA